MRLLPTRDAGTFCRVSATGERAGLTNRRLWVQVPYSAPLWFHSQVGLKAIGCNPMNVGSNPSGTSIWAVSKLGGCARLKPVRSRVGTYTAHHHPVGWLGRPQHRETTHEYFFICIYFCWRRSCNHAAYIVY